MLSIFTFRIARACDRDDSFNGTDSEQIGVGQGLNDPQKRGTFQASILFLRLLVICFAWVRAMRFLPFPDACKLSYTSVVTDLSRGAAMDRCSILCHGVHTIGLQVC